MYIKPKTGGVRLRPPPEELQQSLATALEDPCAIEELKRSLDERSQGQLIPLGNLGMEEHE